MWSMRDRDPGRQVSSQWKARGKQSMVVRAVFACVCIYSTCVYLHVFMKEAGAKPGLTEERWEELN